MQLKKRLLSYIFVLGPFNDVLFEVLAAAKMTMVKFYDVTSFGLAVRHQRFVETHCHNPEQYGVI
jgi:hypothetical protein